MRRNALSVIVLSQVLIRCLTINVAFLKILSTRIWLLLVHLSTPCPPSPRIVDSRQPKVAISTSNSLVMQAIIMHLSVSKGCPKAIKFQTFLCLTFKLMCLQICVLQQHLRLHQTRILSRVSLMNHSFALARSKTITNHRRCRSRGSKTLDSLFLSFQL